MQAPSYSRALFFQDFYKLTPKSHQNSLWRDVRAGGRSGKERSGTAF